MGMWFLICSGQQFSGHLKDFKFKISRQEKRHWQSFLISEKFPELRLAFSVNVDRAPEKFQM
jgi:hypothetical protein